MWTIDLQGLFCALCLLLPWLAPLAFYGIERWLLCELISGEAAMQMISVRFAYNIMDGHRFHVQNRMKRTLLSTRLLIRFTYPGTKGETHVFEIGHLKPHESKTIAHHHGIGGEIESITTLASLIR